MCQGFLEKGEFALPQHSKGGLTMYIYRYKADSAIGFEKVQVKDDYQLQKGELKELPNPCYTPMILDSNDNLVSNTLEASNEKAKEYLEKNNLNSTSMNVSAQIAKLTVQMAQQQQNSSTQISVLAKQVATLQAKIDSLTATNKEA